MQPEVIPEESIYSAEQVFGLFGADEDKLPGYLAGTLCLEISVSDFRGRTATWAKPIALMSVAISEVNNVTIEWHTEVYGQERKLEKLELR